MCKTQYLTPWSIGLVFALVGCAAYVPPSQQAVIDAQKANADAFDDKIQARPTATQPAENVGIPAPVKQWVHEERRSWDAMSDWGHGKKPGN